MGRHEAIVEQRKLSPAEQILDRHGLGHLLETEIINPHTGELTTVSGALETCPPFAGMIDTLDQSLPAEQFALGVATYIEEQRIKTAGDA